MYFYTGTKIPLESQQLNYYTVFHGYHNHFIVSCANFIMTKVCIICLNVFCYFFQTFSPHMGSLKSHTKRPLYRNQDESFTMNNDNTFYHEYPNKPFINDDYRQTKPTKAYPENNRTGK